MVVLLTVAISFPVQTRRGALARRRKSGVGNGLVLGLTQVRSMGGPACSGFRIGLEPPAESDAVIASGNRLGPRRLSAQTSRARGANRLSRHYHRIEPGCTSRHTLGSFQAPGCSSPEPEGACHFPSKSFVPFIALGGCLMSRVRHYLSKLSDCDDALRRLADVLQVPAASTSAAGRNDAGAVTARHAISSGASSSPMRCWMICTSTASAGPNGAGPSRSCSVGSPQG